MERLSFKLAEFEGPLDLLLYLIQKHKLDIYDIPITQLLEQYLDYIHAMEDADLELASEFLEMASRLVYIKTVMLLPKHEQEGEQLKTELQGQLLEYQVCKQVAMQLGERKRMDVLLVREPMQFSIDQAYQLHHDPQKLLAAYQDAIGKGKRRLPPPVQAFSGIVARQVVSVNSRIIYLLKLFYRKGRIGYDRLFASSRGRSELVATFLAVLELVKSKRILIEENEVCFIHTANQPPITKELDYD